MPAWGIAIRWVGRLGNIQARIQTMVSKAVKDQWFKNYFKINGIQQIAGKINTDIFRFRSGKILKLVPKKL